MSDKMFFHADDGATYYIVAESPKHALELLIGHGFMDGCEVGEGAGVELLTQERADQIKVYMDDRGETRAPLSSADIGSVFSSEW